jgi:hypothetical protein
MRGQGLVKGRNVVKFPFLGLCVSHSLYFLIPNVERNTCNHTRELVNFEQRQFFVTGVTLPLLAGARCLNVVLARISECR